MPGLVPERIVIRSLLALLLGTILALGCQGATAADDRKREKARPTYLSLAQVWKTRPVRRDAPLREENITDLEVAEIEAEMRSLYPGSIVYISAVTTGCPCEDGPDCTDLVWSVATLGGKSRGLALSNIAGVWQIGPLQQWWLTYDLLWATFRASRNDDSRPRSMSYREYRERVAEHVEAFPKCNGAMQLEDIRIESGSDE